MTHSQISRADRGARQKARPSTAARGGLSEDPQLRRMLTTHIHCGEPMQPVPVDPGPPVGSPGRNDGGLLTYRCACGFRFDQRRD